MFTVLKFFWLIAQSSWDIMNPNLNPLRAAPPHIKYFASILLGCFWSLAFGVYAGELYYIGYNMFGHIAIISMVFVTWYVFRRVKNTYGPGTYPLMRDPKFSPKCYEMTDDERIVASARADQLLLNKR